MTEHPDPPTTLRDLLAARLAPSSLSDEARSLLLDALGADVDTRQDDGDRAGQRSYLQSIAVTGFRGIGSESRLALSPIPGVTLIVGRNGSGKSSFADGAEIAFTGTNTRWAGRNPVWRSNWRNLHDGTAPKVEVKLCMRGDPGPSTLTRTWPGDDVAVSEAEFKRPGHGRGPFARMGWEQPLAHYRPFLSYSDLDRMISGKPTEMYDAVATILGLGPLSDAGRKLQAAEKALDNAVKEAGAKVPGLLEALSALEDPRADSALSALADPRSPDLDQVAALVSGLPAADSDTLARLRRTASLAGPDLAVVGPAVDRLREAVAVADDVRASGSEDAHQRAELLDQALRHTHRHPDETDCPVCGSEGRLDQEWAERAAGQVAALRQEASAAQAARRELLDAVDAVRYLVSQPPTWLPEALADPWREWADCRGVTVPAQLAARAENAAVVLADACHVLREEALRHLEKLDEGWRLVAVRLAGWLDEHRRAEDGRPRLRQVRAARKWLKEAFAELRQERLRPFADRSQRIWEELRQQSNVDLRSVKLTGSDNATVRKLVMDVSVDGMEASALSVMSQGELHSLALALFLPRATAADSPFGFVVIDDPVQSMDPAKVHGLAGVLHELGKERQVVVFTHDTRLPQAFKDLEHPVTVLEVERGERSAVTVRKALDPVGQALNDARALAATKGLSQEAVTHVLPGICRTALEAAFAESARRRMHRAGDSEYKVDQALENAPGLRGIAALGLFGDASRTADVLPELRGRCGPKAMDVWGRCQEGAHVGTSLPDPKAFVGAVGRVAQEVRNP